MQKVLHCDCGFEARGEDEDKLVSEVQRHALEAHGMTLTRAQVLALAARAEPDKSTNGKEQT
jgi:predicted small metal-binding protein